MTRESFNTILNKYKNITEDIDELYEIGFDLVGSKYRISDKVEELFYDSLLSHYTEDGTQWVKWFISENNWGENHYEAYDTEHNLIAQTIDTLYDLLEKDYKIPIQKVFGKRIN